jgi:two-component system sensor histidine kinase UhpB
MIDFLQPLTILVVEDSQADYLVFAECLSRSLLSVKSIVRARSLQESISILDKRSSPPDLIFMDLTLPDSQGLDSFIQINAKVPNTPIIVVSGVSDIQVALSTIAKGAEDYLMKGEFDEKILTKTIQYGIERKKIFRKVVENNERYNTIIKATNDTIWDWDLRTNEFIWNEGIANTFGYPFGKEINNVKWYHQKIHPQDRKQFTAKVKQYLTSNVDHWQEEYRLKTADGSYKDVYDRGYILKNEQQIPYRIIGAIIDVSAQKRKQNDFIKDRLHLQKLIAKATIQTHELERKEIGVELHENINQVLATACLCINFAMNEDTKREDLLLKSKECLSQAISKIQNLTQSLVPSALFDIGLKEALEEMIAEIYKSHGLQITLVTKEDAFKKLSGSKKLTIYRIVQEQINNIIKHSQAKEAQIELRTGRNSFYMTIKDNGVGFDPTNNYHGQGFANIITRLQMHEGKLDIRTAPQQGYTLNIEIPFA